VAEVLAQPNGQESLAFEVAKNYFNAFAHIAGRSNTVVIPQVCLFCLPKILLLA
jgi:hypothetical protein